MAIWLQARVHLAAAASVDERARASRRARRAIRSLRGEGLVHTAVWAELLRATERTGAGDIATRRPLRCAGPPPSATTTYSSTA